MGNRMEQAMDNVIDPVGISLTPISTAGFTLPDASQLSPTAVRVRHHLIPARPVTCARAPCLKRAPFPTLARNLEPQVNCPNPTFFLDTVTSRHVHFDDSPPEQFVVHSGEKYDRRSIKCTQGGSEFDLSLPPRSCSSFSTDSDQEEDDDAAAAAAVTPHHDEQESDIDFSRRLIENNTLPAFENGIFQQIGLSSCRPSLHGSRWSLTHGNQVGDASKLQEDANKMADDSSPKGEPTCMTLRSSISSPQRTPHTKAISPDATPMPSPNILKSTNGPSPAQSGYFEILQPTRGRLLSDGRMATDAVATHQSVTPHASLARLATFTQDKQVLSITTSFDDAGDALLVSPLNAHLQEVEAVKPTTSPTTMLGHGLDLWFEAATSSSSSTYPHPTLVDHWSGLSSDGDTTDSPSNETSWISSSCTSPELVPTDHSFYESKPSPTSSASSLYEHNPSLVACVDDSRFSSSIETVKAFQLDQPIPMAIYNSCNGYTSAALSISEDMAADPCRRSSFDSYQLESFQLSCKLKSRKAVSSPDMPVLRTSRTRSSSKDGSARKKAKSFKCKACKTARQKEKEAMSVAFSRDDEQGSTFSFEQGIPRHTYDRSMSAIDLAADTVENMASLSLTQFSPHGSGSSVSVETKETFTKQTGLASLDSPLSGEKFSPVLECTCDKKEKELLRKRIGKERELEREREREWERKYVGGGGRPERLFGDGFGGGDCLSALDGF